MYLQRVPAPGQEGDFPFEELLGDLQLMFVA